MVHKGDILRVVPGITDNRKKLVILHCKKRLAIFPSPAGMSLTKFTLAENNLFFPGQGEFG
jgi:hypothetical protein